MSKLLKGCSIGCGGLLLILIIAGVLGYSYFSSRISNIKEISDSVDSLDVKYSSENTFVYSANSSDKEKIKSFIELRKELNSHFVQQTDDIRSFDFHLQQAGEKKDESFSSAFSLGKETIEVVPKILNYFTIRDSLLNKYGFTHSEYIFYYASIYNVILGEKISQGLLILFMDLKNSNFALNIDKHKDFATQAKFMIDSRARLFENRIRKMLSDSGIKAPETGKLKESQENLQVYGEGLSKEFINEVTKQKHELMKVYNKYLNPLEYYFL